MKTATIDIEEIRRIVHDEVKQAVRELLEEYEFITEDDFFDREQAMQQLKNGKALVWDDYKKKRGIK
ncbi:hypothetical protein J7L68_06650 [bacterium]|nr:hypothetical protein [bacterium]